MVILVALRGRERRAKAEKVTKVEAKRLPSGLIFFGNSGDSLRHIIPHWFKI
jgi:hypothetical protein